MDILTEFYPGEGVSCNTQSFDDIECGSAVSQHPRLAGDGTLTLPAKVALDNQGFIRGRYSERTVDPFEWTADRLLLAESFARLDLGDRRAMKAWWVTHGALNPLDFTGGDADRPDEDEWNEFRQPADAFADSREEAADEQANVRWHLATLVRLSDTRETMDWDPTWAELVLDGDAGGTYLLGGDHSGTEVWPAQRFDLVRRFPEERSTYGDPAEQVALLPEVARRPRVHVRVTDWYGYWAPEPWAPEPVNDESTGLLKSTGLLPDVARLGSTWESMLELERLLVEPNVARAVERRFRIELEPRGEDGRKVLVPREDRQWNSILAPIYLQLFEALRRISGGEPGAATCRECRRPFLVLDARRRFFCNDRERFRFSQREHRRRLSAPPA